MSPEKVRGYNGNGTLTHVIVCCYAVSFSSIYPHKMQAKCTTVSRKKYLIATSDKPATIKKELCYNESASLKEVTSIFYKSAFSRTVLN